MIWRIRGKELYDCCSHSLCQQKKLDMVLKAWRTYKASLAQETKDQLILFLGQQLRRHVIDDRAFPQRGFRGCHPLYWIDVSCTSDVCHSTLTVIQGKKCRKFPAGFKMRHEKRGQKDDSDSDKLNQNETWWRWYSRRSSRSRRRRRRSKESHLFLLFFFSSFSLYVIWPSSCFLWRKYKRMTSLFYIPFSCIPYFCCIYCWTWTWFDLNTIKD